MVAAGVAKRLDEKVWMDIDGNIVDCKEKAHSMKVDTVLTHLGYALFVDEVRNNTNQKKDGHIGGGKYLCERGTTPKEICSTRGAHFTVSCGVEFAGGRQHAQRYHQYATYACT
jgi:hypothetical protein